MNTTERNHLLEELARDYERLADQAHDKARRYARNPRALPGKFKEQARAFQAAADHARSKMEET